MRLLAEISVRRALPGELTTLVECDSDAQLHASRRVELEGWLLAGAVLVAESQARALGFAVLEHTFFGQGFVPLLAVAASARRQGVATRLLAAAESACQTSKLFTSTNESNTAAQALLARAGFVRSGTIENLDAEDREFVYFKPVRL